MVLRKPRQRTPGFKITSPLEPITGERAQLYSPGQFPYCALMQVAASDTHENYVICRGWDPRDGRFYDYVDGDEDKVGIAVAKPYDNRATGAYEIGQVFPALIPLGAEVVPVDSPFGPLGENPGVAETSSGHPTDLQEAVELLYDDDGKPITWMLIEAGSAPIESVLFMNEDAGACPPYALIEGHGTDYHPDTGEVYIHGGKASANEPEYTYWVNAPESVGSAEYGRCYSLLGKKRLVLCDFGAEIAGNPQLPCGPTVGEWYLQQLRTGFLAVGASDGTYDPGGGLLLNWVQQRPGPCMFIAAATANVDHDDANFNVDSIEMISGICPVDDINADTVLVDNDFGLEMATDDIVLVIYDPFDGDFVGVAGFRSRLSDTRVFLDNAMQSHVVTIQRGVILSWTIT